MQTGRDATFHRVSSWRHTALVFTMMAAACTADQPTALRSRITARGLVPHKDHSSDPGFICEGNINNPCGGVTATSSFPEGHGIEDGNRTAPTSDTVTISFSAPVAFADILAAHPFSTLCESDIGEIFPCTFNHPAAGTLVAFDAAGTEVDRQPLTDGGGNFSLATVGNPGGITKVLILPTESLGFLMSFDVFEMAEARRLTVACGGEVVRGTDVHCVTSMNPPADYVITHVRSTTNGTTITDQAVLIAPTGTGANQHWDWSGTAAVNTTVTITAKLTDGTATLVGTDFFSAESRMGQTTWPIADPPAPLPPPQAASTHPPLKQAYPSFNGSSGNGLSWISGGIGMSFWPWDGLRFGRIGGPGPNIGVAYVLSPPRLTQGKTQIWYAQSLDPTDPFALAQTGGIDTNRGRPFCTTATMSALKSGVLHHENGHGIEQQLQLDQVRVGLEETTTLLQRGPGAPDLAAQLDAWGKQLEAQVELAADAAAVLVVDADGPYTVLAPNCTARFP